MNDVELQFDPTASTRIDAVFRNGSLTGVSVMLGFSLSFLTRWAGSPGTWQTIDFIALTAIFMGIIVQTLALACLLSVKSLFLHFYRRTVYTFLLGLAFVWLGIAAAIAGDLFGYGQRILG